MELESLHSLRNQDPSIYSCIGSVTKGNLFLTLAEIPIAKVWIYLTNCVQKHAG